MTPNSQGDADSTPDAAREQASQITDEAKGAAGQMAGTARQEASQVTNEARDHAKSLASSARDEALSQAATQQQRLAEQARVATDDLQRLARGEQPESDLVGQVISTVADRAHQLTSALETKSPEDLLTGVRRFAARRPGTFLAVAAGVGLVAGRLTRGLADSNDAPAAATSPDVPTPAHPMPAPADPTFDFPERVDPVPAIDPLSTPLFGQGPSGADTIDPGGR